MKERFGLCSCSEPLFNVIAFFIHRKHNIWIAYAFSAIAFASDCNLKLAFKGTDTIKSKFGIRYFLLGLGIW